MFWLKVIVFTWVGQKVSIIFYGDINMYYMFRNVKMVCVFFSMVCGAAQVNAAKYELDKEAGVGSFNKKEFQIQNTIQGFNELQKPNETKKVINNYSLVIDLIKQKKINEASDKVERLIKENPSQSVYFNLKGLVDVIRKDNQAAKASYNKAIKLNPGNIQAYVSLAKIMLDEKRYTQAKKYVNQALAIDKYSITSYKILADVTMQQKGVEEVQKLLNEANIDVQGNTKAEIEILKLLGKTFVSQKHPERLLPLTSKLVERNPGNLLALSFQVEVFLLNKDKNAAEKVLQKVIAKESKDVKHRFLLARLLAERKADEREILNLLDQAESNSENSYAVLLYKSSFLISQKKYKEAFDVAQQVEEKYPKQNFSAIIKGDIYRAEQKYNGALRSYLKAFRQRPTQNLLDSVVSIFAIQKRGEELLAFLDAETTKHKDNEMIRFKLADAYLRREMYQKAIPHYQILLSKQAGNSILLNNLAWAYSQVNEDSKALMMAEKAHGIAPESGTVADTYGYILLKSGDVEKSLVILNSAIGKKPNVFIIQLHFAEALIANGQNQEAHDLLQSLAGKPGIKQEQINRLLKKITL